MTEPNSTDAAPKAKFCNSCTASLMVPMFQGKSDIYCKYCTDDAGELKSYEEAKAGIVHWLLSWQPGVDQELAESRARHFMRAMPAWADHS